MRKRILYTAELSIITTTSSKYNYLRKIEKETGTATNLISRAALHLSDLGIIEYIKPTKDKRIKRLRLTEKGIKLKEQILLLKELTQ